jgi:hypothetical protein
MALTGAADAIELYAFAAQCGVEVRPGLLPREREAAARATDLIRRLLREAHLRNPATVLAQPNASSMRFLTRWLTA